MRTLTFARMGALAILALLVWPATAAPASGQYAMPERISATSIPGSALIQPQQLDRMLHEKATQKPLILQVGSHLMYDEAHIPGSEYAGPGSQQSGLNLLRQRVESLKHTTPIIIYCGCCPWTHCPNIGPAFAMLHRMGFTQVKALYLANNFGTDWVNKGYPVESSH